MRALVILLLFVTNADLQAQVPADSFRVEDAKKILNFLASDSMKGRQNYSPEIRVAANYIAQSFQQAGLSTLPASKTYFYPFVIRKKLEVLKDSVGMAYPEDVLLNVIGVLPGKSKPKELVIFSAHYDHVGIIGKKIYNGANDNASGTTALLMLAKYFAQRADNERTLVFCAFAGEEMGLHGSKVLAPRIQSDAIVAVINLEMLGIPQVGKNAFFVTGSQHSNFKNILESSLNGGCKIVPEPSAEKELFLRSDNYPFAQRGVPAHSIMASDDDDKCYHRSCDDIKRIDFDNLVNLVKCIAVATAGIINGTQTPSRIKTERLQDSY